MYHAWWPSAGDPFYQHNVPENDGRIYYYDIPWVPFELTDGVLEIDFPPTDALFQQAYDERKGVPTTVSLELEGAYVPDTGQVDVTVTASNGGFLMPADYRLHLVLTESGLYFDAPNGQDWHEYTMRDMIPDEGGTPIAFAGGFPQVDQVSTGFVCDPAYVPEHCQLVYFVQNHDTAEILQAGKTDLMDLVDMTAAPAAPPALALGRNFPNPFNPRTTLPVTLREAGAARLDVLDASGRLVRRLHDGALAAGDHAFVWDGTDAAGGAVGSGVYLYRLRTAEGARTRKMLLLK
jgi:hypothetical protein